MTLEQYKREYLLHNEDSLDDFSKNLGLVFEEIEPGYAKAKMNLKKELVNPIGSIHGGALFSVADIVSGVAANANHVNVTTLDSSIHFLAPAFWGRDEYLVVEAKTKKAGKTVHVMDVDITNVQGKLIVNAQFTFFVMR